MVRAMLALTPFAAVLAAPPEVAALAARTPLLFTRLFGRRLRLGGSGAPFDGVTALFGRRPARLRLAMGLMSAMPLLRTPRAAPLLAAATGPPHLDKLGLRYRCRQLGRLRIGSHRSGNRRRFGGARLRSSNDRPGGGRRRVGHAMVLDNR